MKNLKVLINNKKYVIKIIYNEELNRLSIAVLDEKGYRLTDSNVKLIINELFKGDLHIVEENAEFKTFKYEKKPFTIYFDSKSVLIPSLFYKNNDFDNMEEIKLVIPKLKREEILNTSLKITLYFLLLTLVINFCHSKIEEKKFNQNVEETYQSVLENFDYSYLCEMIYQNENLTVEEKELFTSSMFLRDLANTPMTLEQSAILCFNLKNMVIEEFGFIRKGKNKLDKLIGNPNVLGYVSDKVYKRNVINIYEDDMNEADLIKTHEFVHVTQCNFKYKYLIEAVAEIVSSDYWLNPILAYSNAVIRIRLLAYILGPEVVWNSVFASPEYLENELSKYLNADELEIFLNCLSISPNSQRVDEKTGIGDVDAEVDYYLKLIYERKFDDSFEESKTIQMLYNADKYGNVYIDDGDIYVTSKYFCFNQDMNFNRLNYQRPKIKMKTLEE
jgi:hypothetical protein